MLKQQYKLDIVADPQPIPQYGDEHLDARDVRSSRGRTYHRDINDLGMNEEGDYDRDINEDGMNEEGGDDLDAEDYYDGGSL